MVELVIVMLVLGLVAAAGQPVINSSVDRARLSAAADQVVAALEYARHSAAACGSPWRVTVDATADTLGVERLRSDVDFTDPALTEVARSQAEALSYSAVRHPANRGSRYRVDFGNGAGYRSVDVVSAEFWSGGSVIFDARGVPSGAGRVVLERGGRRATVTLDALTGRVSRSD